MPLIVTTPKGFYASPSWLRLDAEQFLAFKQATSHNQVALAWIQDLETVLRPISAIATGMPHLRDHFLSTAPLPLLEHHTIDAHVWDNVEAPIVTLTWEAISRARLGFTDLARAVWGKHGAAVNAAVRDFDRTIPSAAQMARSMLMKVTELRPGWQVQEDVGWALWLGWGKTHGFLNTVGHPGPAGGARLFESLTLAARYARALKMSRTRPGAIVRMRTRVHEALHTHESRKLRKTVHEMFELPDTLRSALAHSEGSRILEGMLGDQINNPPLDAVAALGSFGFARWVEMTNFSYMARPDIRGPWSSNPPLQGFLSHAQRPGSLSGCALSARLEDLLPEPYQLGGSVVVRVFTEPLSIDAVMGSPNTKPLDAAIGWGQFLHDEQSRALAAHEARSAKKSPPRI